MNYLSILTAIYLIQYTEKNTKFENEDNKLLLILKNKNYVLNQA